MFDLDFTGERVVPGKVEEHLFLEHVSRYRFAARFARGRVALDFGCGTGYGAAVLRRAGARRVVGSDLAPDAIRYARGHYGRAGLDFCVADCEAGCFASGAFGLITAFELIEHLRDYRAFLAEVRRMLAPGGLFLVSTPNKRTYRTEPGTPPNPFHVHEFEIGELDDTLHDFFPGVSILGQSRTEGVLFHRPGRATGDPARRAVLTAESPGAAELLSGSAYLLAVCSDDPAAVEIGDADELQVADTNAVRTRDLRILQLQDELEERTRWARGLEEESSRRGQRVLELQGELEERERRVRQIEGESEARARRILELQAELEERLRWAERIEHESEGRGRRIVELQGELELLGSSIRRLDGLEQRVDERVAAIERGLGAEIESLRDELARRAERDREREEIERWHRDSLIRQQQEIERHRHALAESARRSTENERLIEQQRRLVDRLGLALRALSRRADHHQAELAAWIAQAREIEISADRARELVDLLWASRSWRLYAGAKRLVETLTPRRPARKTAQSTAGTTAALPGGAGGPLRALVVDHRLPTPDRDAGSVRMVEVLRQLQSLGFEVVFLPENLYAMEPYCEQLRRLGVEVVVAPRVTSLTQYLAAEGASFQLALVSRLHIAAGCLDSVRELCRNAKLVFDTVDLQHLRLERQAELEGDAALAAEAERAKVEELAMAARADATLVVSDAERDLLRREVPGLAVHRVSLIEQVRSEVPGFDGREGFYFVGGFEHPPNVDAVLWFAAEVLPEIRRELPRATFFVLGSKTPEAVHALEGDGVVVTGHVPEMERYLLGCRLSVAPLRYGAGIKGKVTQSLAFGLPCVMTTIAAEGIGLTHGEDALIADDPADLARCVIDAYRDRELWEKLSAAGRERIRERFSPAVARAALAALVTELGIEIEEAADA